MSILNVLSSCAFGKTWKSGDYDPAFRSLFLDSLSLDPLFFAFTFSSTSSLLLLFCFLKKIVRAVIGGRYPVDKPAGALRGPVPLPVNSL
jgi:hypothetical protein